MEWQDIYLFISSTFNDMHAERDYLVKHVFPELSAQCEKYRLRVIDIDLRWGITTADSEAKNTVRVCLEHIDKCRPFFLCFLGQRRGWVPDESDLRNACTEYPRLSAHAGKDSVTEMEVEHALLSPMYRIVDGNREELPPAGHALFFFREDTFTHLLTPKQRLIYTNDAVLENKGDPAEEDTRLARFKEKVRKSRRPVTPYSATWVATIESPELLDEEKGGKEAAQGRLTGFTAKGADLKHGIIAQILAEISAAYPDRFQAGEAASGESAQAKELEQQELFIRLHSEGYIPRADATGKLDAYMNSRTDGMCLLTAGAGLGKTMMLANYVLQLRKRPLNVYARFCGVSDLSSDPYS
ncbi:MAG: DUF4062 domain-containing protein, partial [Tannerellaceae bacterium]|nr:DUF4062 domain-containing protein [Tannerellaceae bacterium]